ncbi:DUF6011 domain-containing protein [Arthrobacter flavus]|uniref:DUF6011 domain-containing protein n=1 Tax=Arthrobacter flavus TaxID=95172 RepID=A0ABW4Q3X4_9MICC
MIAAPTAAVIAEMQRYADSVGLVLTTRCTRCKAPLWNPKSLHHHLGPVCRAKENGLDTPAKKSVQTVTGTRSNG